MNLQLQFINITLHLKISPIHIRGGTKKVINFVVYWKMPDTATFRKTSRKKLINHNVFISCFMRNASKKGILWVFPKTLFLIKINMSKICN